MTEFANWVTELTNAVTELTGLVAAFASAVTAFANAVTKLASLVAAPGNPVTAHPCAVPELPPAMTERANVSQLFPSRGHIASDPSGHTPHAPTASPIKTPNTVPRMRIGA